MSRVLVPFLLTFIVSQTFVLANLSGPKSGDYEDTVQELAHNNNEVATKLYQLLSSSSNENLVFSPFSLRTVCAMLEVGARGKTKTEITNAMEFPSSEEHLFNGYYDLLRKAERSTEFTTLESANRIYVAREFNVTDNFQVLQKRYFIAPHGQVDFSSKKAAEQINNWISGKTRHLIERVVEPSSLTNETRMVVINTLYFKGAWEMRFHPGVTRKGVFYQNEHAATDVDMMTTDDHFRYVTLPDLDASMVVLPYVSKNPNDQFRMVLIVPNNRTGLRHVEDKLVQDITLQDLLSRIPEQSKYISLTMPKFKIESSLDLMDSLQTMGMKTMFSKDDADFTGIPSQPQENPLYVSKLIQKATLSLDEYGTEASAATVAVIFTPLSISPQIDAKVVIDRPFLGFIHDTKSNAILFVFRKTE